MNRILLGDCLAVLPNVPEAFARLIYIDPPFNTGTSQARDRIRAVADSNGDRVGFGGRRYRTVRPAETVEAKNPISPRARTGGARYADAFDDYLGFLVPRIEAGVRCLTADGSLFVHLDYHEVHYVKVALDRLLGRERFINEIIWAYDYGGRPKDRWPAKHDTILWYAMDPSRYVFNFDAIDRIPYMAPDLVGAEKAARGKTPTDVWWHTIVPTNSKEKTGYPTQKPLGILRRLIAVHSDPGDIVLDFFAGSGTTGAAAAELGRGYVLIDENPDAVRIMERRLSSPTTATSR